MIARLGVGAGFNAPSWPITDGRHDPVADVAGQASDSYRTAQTSREQDEHASTSHFSLTVSPRSQIRALVQQVISPMVRMAIVVQAQSR